MTRRELRALFARLLDAPNAIITVSPQPHWGEYTSNFPLQQAKKRGQTPAQIGQTARERLGPFWSGHIVLEQGRLQFHMSDDTFLLELERATREGAHYGASNFLAGQRILVEYVSSDPTGPLPFGAGRHAAWGEALCRLLESAGARVSREFYLNDQTSSSKLRALGESVANAYSSAFGRNTGLSTAFARTLGGEWARHEGARWLQESPEDRLEAATNFALERAVELQRTSLERFGTHFDSWVKESDLERNGQIERVLAQLTERGLTFTRDGALWLRTTEFGDDADRVLRRASGRATYFAADIAYHSWKAERGFDHVLNVWSAGHGPYIPRTKAALRAAGLDESKFEFLTVEEAALERDGLPIRLGLGGGPLVLDEEVEEIGSDALHWFFVAKPASKVAAVDLEITTRDDESNPAYAAQLLPSRLATMRRALEGRLSSTAPGDEDAWNPGERELARLVALWPDCLENAAKDRAPEKVADFVSQLAKATRELSRQNAPSLAPTTRRLDLLRAAGNVATNALKILGLDANERF